jgi:hypothetical protein
VSKVLLHHSNLSTTQRYLGKNNDAKATQWVDNPYGGSVMAGLRISFWSGYFKEDVPG